MKRAIMIGLGCLLLAGCGPEGASDMEDEARPLLSTSASDALTESTIAIGGISGSIKPCPACSGKWNPESCTLTYSIPEDTDVSSTTLTLVLSYEDRDPQTCVFEDRSSTGEVAVDCGLEGSPISAELVFFSDSTPMSASILIAATPLPAY